MPERRLIVGISGSTGIIYGIRLLEILREVPDVRTHLIITPAAVRSLTLETDYTLQEVEALADEVHHFRDIAAN